MMIPGLTAEEARLIHRSVGWGTHKKGRPLSPIEVGDLFGKALSAGASIQECATTFPLSPSNVSRFIRVAALAPDIRHLVSWGKAPGALGFTTAVEIARDQDPADQRALATGVIKNDMTAAEVRQAVQLRRRSSKSIQECIEESIGMRPQLQKRYVFVGAIADPEHMTLLRSLTQQQRNELLMEILHSLGLSRIAGTLGEELFTLVGSEASGSDLAGPAAESLEERIVTALREVRHNA